MGDAPVELEAEAYPEAGKEAVADLEPNKAKSLLDAKFKGLYVPLFIKMFIHLS